MEKKSKWGRARKRPVEVEYREPKTNGYAFPDINKGGIDVEWIDTLEGKLYALPERDFVIRGVKGELYPIRKDIFEETYEVTQDCAELRSKPE